MTLAEIEKGLGPDTLAELRAAGVTAGRPVIAIDVDDTLVWFVDHLSRWMTVRGFEMRLESYQLEGSMFKTGSDIPLPFEDCIAIINDFFRAETESQEAIPGAVEAVGALSADAQVVILTNVPRHAAAARRVNLTALGFDQPLIVNSGGKGRAMAWLAARSDAPVALVDDSSMQMDSLRKRLPDAIGIHFAGAAHIARLYPDCQHATAQVHDWSGCTDALRHHLGLAPR